MGAEEILSRYDPGRSNDRVLSQLQRFRDQELEALRRTGDMQAAAKRESLQNIGQLPQKVSEGYLAGTEEARRAQQQEMLQAQEARQRELHPLNVEGQKTQLERSKFGLSEEQKQAADIQRKRDYLTRKRPDGMTQEEYDFELDRQTREANLSGVKAQTAASAASTQLTQGQIADEKRKRAWLTAPRNDGSGMTNEQYLANLDIQGKEASIQNAKNTNASLDASRRLTEQQLNSLSEDQQVKKMTAVYLNAINSGDQNQIKSVDADMQKNLHPAVYAMVKTGAGAQYRSQIETSNMVWQSSPVGQETMASLSNLRQKASTLQQVKANIAEYKTTNWETDRANQLKQNIISLLSRPEMGVEGQTAANAVASGLAGLRADLGGVSTASQRIDNSLDNINKVIEAQLQQLEVQNQNVKVPIYQQTLDSTKAALKQAISTTTNKQAPLLINGKSYRTNTLVPGVQPVSQPNETPLVPPVSQFRK